VKPTRFSSRWLAVSLLLGCGGCASFERSLTEFDSVTGRDRAIEEPDAIEYEEYPFEYPRLAALMDLFGTWVVDALFDLADERLRHSMRKAERELLGPTPIASTKKLVDPEEVTTSSDASLPNPAVFARDRLESVVARSAGSRYKTAIAANRVLWFLALDSYPRNLVLGVQSIEDVLARMGVDPMEVAMPGAPSADEEARIAAQIAVLEKSWPVRRAGRELTSEERATYAQALAEITRTPAANRKTQRSLVRALAEAERGEADLVLSAATAAAVDRALAFALATGLRDVLRSTLPQPREEAMLAIYRLGGARAVPGLLAWCTRRNSQGATPARRYDQEVQNRRTLVRICSRLPRDVAVTAAGSGPAPVEFLYEILTTDVPELRPIALEALAQCLGRREYFDAENLDDHAWADAWWRDWVVSHKRSP